MATYKDLPAPPEPKAVYSIEEVAALLGVHRTTVSGFIKSGELRASRLGHRTVRISYEALLEFLRLKEVGGGEANKEGEIESKG
jgi:excisionase family DNA binding protein